jgi:ureidoacrylate peracid hydrolase
MTDRRARMDALLALRPASTALLVIDMQRGFVHAGEAMEVPAAREAVPRIRTLVDAFRAKGRPVVFTEFVYSDAAPLLVGAIHPEHLRALPGTPRGFGVPSSSCHEDDPSVATVDELAPRADELVVRKRWYDAFAGTPLDGALRARGVDTLVVTGTMTDICVLATVVGAFSREYRITVVEDAVTTLWPEIHRATLDIIGRAYGRITSAKEVADVVGAWESAKETS